MFAGVKKPEHEKLGLKEVAKLTNKEFGGIDGFRRIDYTLVNKIRSKNKKEKEKYTK